MILEQAMLSYAKIQSKPQVLKSLTGLTQSEFESLLKSFEVAWETYIEEAYIQKPRARSYGGGRHAKLLSIEDKLLFILVYFWLYPIQAVQGFLFDLGQPQAHEWVHKLTRVLYQALGYEKQLPEREPSRLKQVLQQCPSLEFLIDGTERPIQRPKDSETQQDTYSGKKKRNTVKNNVISERKGRVVFLSDTYGGRVHDKAICDGEEYEFPEGSTLWQDSGFQGFSPSGVTIRQPRKKKPKQPLSEEDKQHNQIISSERVEVEHQIGGIKRCNIVSHPFRNRTDYYVDDVMETACGLHNFRLTHRQLKAQKQAA